MKAELSKKTKSKAKVSKPKKKPNSRIKQVGDTHWVLSKDNRVKKYKGFSSSQDAEQYAAATPVDKTVKINAERAVKARSGKSKSRNGKKKKIYETPSLRMIEGTKDRKSGAGGIVQSFSEGKEKYGKGKDK